MILLAFLTGFAIGVLVHAATTRRAARRLARRPTVTWAWTTA